MNIKSTEAPQSSSKLLPLTIAIPFLSLENGSLKLASRLLLAYSFRYLDAEIFSLGMGNCQYCDLPQYD